MTTPAIFDIVNVLPARSSFIRRDRPTSASNLELDFSVLEQ